MLSPEAINEFRALYKERYGVELSLEEASKCAHALFKLYKAVCVGDQTDEANQPPDVTKESDER